MDVKRKFKFNNKEYHYYDLSVFEQETNISLKRVPKSFKVLIENLLRNSDGSIENVKALLNQEKKTIYFYPARVLMQDFTGVPALVDLAAMRVAAHGMGIDPTSINPMVPVDLVIDHSVQVDRYGDAAAFKTNFLLEMERNLERYQFLKWGQGAFDDFRVVPPGMGICHQINLEYLATVVREKNIGNEDVLIYPDTVVGTDSHTTMINALAILGWGVGGIEAESVMLGEPIAMLIPEVFGVNLTGKLNKGVNATDLVLNITNILREVGVVGKFVEFYGVGLNFLTLSDRATIANMAPEYGATCGFFPIDDKTIKYLALTGRKNSQLIEHYAKVQGLWSDSDVEPEFIDCIEIDLNKITATVAGPKRPQDKVELMNLSKSFYSSFPQAKIGKKKFLKDASIVIAAITSCTNTSNPNLMIASGLLARNALQRGLKKKPWVKTSFAPGSQVVTEYLTKSGLQSSLDELGFNLVGYGCATCIGNSGPLSSDISRKIKDQDLIVASILSGNRNFEGRIHPEVKANYLTSPALVVAYALVGSVDINLHDDPIGQDESGESVYLRDIWPNDSEIEDIVSSVVTPTIFSQKYKRIFEGDAMWQNLNQSCEVLYNWEKDNRYVKHPPYFESMLGNKSIKSINDARIIALLGDSVTTDHISPAGQIPIDTPAGKYLSSLGVERRHFNSYGARRGNHNVMVRGTFANVRIKNEMLLKTEGGLTKHFPSGDIMSIYDAAMLYQEKNTPLVIIAGKEYGTGSSRDWAAKGSLLLGIKVVIAESFERIHRSNLVGMGVLPLMFQYGVNRKSLHMKGDEVIDIDLSSFAPGKEVSCKITRKHSIEVIKLLCRIDTEDEMNYFKNGGILQHTLLKDRIV